MSRSRELALATGLTVLAAAGLLLSAGRTWAVVSQPRAGLPAAIAAATGRDLAPLVTAAGLLGLAGAGALLVTRRWGRLLIGAALLVVGVAVAATVPPRPRASAVSWSARRFGESAQAPTVSTSGWPLVAVVAGALLAAAGALVLLRARTWIGPSRRYDAPAAVASRREQEPATNLETWQALDRGEDPTDPAG